MLDAGDWAPRIEPGEQELGPSGLRDPPLAARRAGALLDFHGSVGLYGWVLSASGIPSVRGPGGTRPVGVTVPSEFEAVDVGSCAR